MNADERATALAAKQHGLVAIRQLRRCGMSDRQVEHRVATGRLLSVRRGVYRVAGVPPSAHERLVAAVLAAGRGSLASHRSAAVLWNVPGIVAPAPEITVPGGRRPQLAGVKVHGVPALGPHDADRRLGIPVTSAARTLGDLSGNVPPAVLERAIDHAHRHRLVSWPALEGVIDMLAADGRRRLGDIRRVVDDRVAPCDGRLAKKVLRELLAAGIRHPELEYQVVVDRHVYLLDMAWLPEMVGVEVLGYDAHGTRSAFDNDAERTAALTAAGYLILPATSRTYRRLPARVGAALAARITTTL